MTAITPHPLTMRMSVQTHYQAELDAGRFCVQRCPQCQRHVFGPRELCPACGASPLRWVKASGLGTVYSASTVHRKAEAGGSYNVALIDLDEGVRMVGRVEGVAPDGVHIGQRMKAKVVKKDGRGLVLFHPAGECGGESGDTG